MTSVAIIGAGLVGSGWAIAFARGGVSVRLWDARPEASKAAIDKVASQLPDLAANGLLKGQAPNDILARIAAAESLEAAVEGVDHVQENAPEDVELKRKVFATLDSATPDNAVIASSTSAILPSAFTEALQGRHRCLVAHPLNPPYLIPATEVVPAPWTDADVVDRTRALFDAIDQKPIVLKRELDGFLVNRLQGALLEEAFRLVADGNARPEDVDAAVREGLALRWSFMGPFETIDLNAPGGVRDYVDRYQGAYANLFSQMQRRVDWAGEVMETVEGDRRAALPAENLEARSQWRDKRLMALAAHKRRMDEELGD